MGDRKVAGGESCKTIVRFHLWMSSIFEISKKHRGNSIYWILFINNDVGLFKFNPHTHNASHT